MNNRPLTLEHILYALALALGLGLRFLNLGALPLSDLEAEWALQALQAARGLRPAIGPNPAYVHLTAVLFFVFEATNFLARFWPALAGSALVAAPWFLRGRLGRLPALILAFGLAIDPGLSALSRQAGGPMLAVACFVLAALAWTDGRRVAAGLLAGLALLSGPSLWFGLAGLALAWALTALTGGKAPAREGEYSRGQEADAGPESVRFEGLGLAASWALGTVLVVGSLLFLSPKGLAAFAASAWAFLSGLWTPSGAPLWQPMLALPAYELLPLGFGLAGLVRGFIKKDDLLSIRLGFWALAALLLVVVYPARQIGDLAWALLPLWALAAGEINRHLDFEGRNLWALAGVITLVIVLLVFGWLELAALTTMDLSQNTAIMRMWLLLAVALLIGLALALVGMGWSKDTARLGGVWGGLAMLLAFTIAAATGATGIRQPRTWELWQAQPRPSRLDVLVRVANQISRLNTGYEAQLPLTIAGLDSPALAWSFRDWPVTTVAALAPEATPDLVITPMGDLSLTADYRGEALALQEATDWRAATSSDWLNWFVYRQVPVMYEDVILWVRSDLMLDGQGLPATTP